MANLCSFSMKVTGKVSNVDRFVERLQGKGDYEDQGGLGRIYDSSVTEEKVLESGMKEAYINGSCAWSIFSAMVGIEGDSVLTESLKNELVVEIYGSEPGMCFQEHYLVTHGSILHNECINYEEHWFQDFDSLEDYNKECGTALTKDMINEDGEIVIGGFGEDYANFENHEAHFNEH